MQLQVVKVVLCASVSVWYSMREHIPVCRMLCVVQRKRTDKAVMKCDKKMRTWEEQVCHLLVKVGIKRRWVFVIRNAAVEWLFRRVIKSLRTNWWVEMRLREEESKNGGALLEGSEVNRETAVWHLDDSFWVRRREINKTIQDKYYCDGSFVACINQTGNSANYQVKIQNSAPIVVCWRDNRSSKDASFYCI